MNLEKTKTNLKQLNRKLLEKVKDEAKKFQEKHHRLPVLMEVCGTHTVALARSGIKQALRDDILLVSGPGCPVCVTHQTEIDAMIALADRENTIVCTFGDMLRVPGTNGRLLEKYHQKNPSVRMIYNPTEAVEIAKQEQNCEVILLGIGFETTMPLHAVAIKKAMEENVRNFSVWTSAKLVPPILEVLLRSDSTVIDGFLLPGHASIVTGVEVFRELLPKYNKSGVVTGFENIEMLGSILILLRALNQNEPVVRNAYDFVVKEKGNRSAQVILDTYFEKADSLWRGLEKVPNSGLELKEEFKDYDAKKKFQLKLAPFAPKTKCQCGDVLKGSISPKQCKLFGKACRPENPIGPCMVSDEGACFSAYEFEREE